MEELEKIFLNKRFEIMELKKILEGINIANYILNLTNEDFIKLFL